MTSFSNNDQKSNISPWADLRSENDCSWVVGVKNALGDRWNSGLGGKVAIVSMMITLVIFITVVVAILG